MSTQYQAQFWNKGRQAYTRFYAHRDEAQDALAKHIGYFNHLGRCHGDGFSNGTCDTAPRNGGEVRICTREL